MVYHSFIITSLLLIGQVVSQIQVDPSCDRTQVLAIGQTYYIYNYQYPQSFGPNTRCRWISKAPQGYKVQLYCNDIAIANSASCTGDRLAVSLTGNPNFVDGHNYCGTGTLSMVSTTTSMSVGLFSENNSQGGRVSCQIRAIADTSPPVVTPTPPGGCDCGRRLQRRIVGGTETGINEYPFVAALINTEERKLFCGATIVHYHYAITAAHCLNKITNVGIIALLVGDHDYGQSGETNSAALYPLDRYINHDGYNPNSQQNDISIVRTQVDMTFSDAVGPVCLPFWYSNSQPPVTSSVTVLGWGTTEFTGAQSKVLLAANLTVVSNAYCQSEYQTRNTIFPTQICTFEDSKDACQSDSGGPVVHLDGNSRRLHLIGVISFGIGCAMDYPGVNTRITTYMEWIIRNTQDATYCQK